MELDEKNLIIYTALIGQNEGLNRQPVFEKCKFRKICFTDDKELTSDDWEIRHVELILPSDNHRSQRNIKLRPHLLFTEFQYSLYIDNTVVLKKPIKEFLEFINSQIGVNLPESQIFLPFHSFRETLIDEFNEVSKCELDDQMKFFEQLRDYSDGNLSILQAKPYWPAIMLRKHSARDIINFSEIWFAHVNRYSRRDQLSIIAAADQANIKLNGFELDNHISKYHKWPIHIAKREKRIFKQKPIDNLPINILDKIIKEKTTIENFKKDFLLKNNINKNPFITRSKTKSSKLKLSKILSKIKNIFFSSGQ